MTLLTGGTLTALPGPQLPATVSNMCTAWSVRPRQNSGRTSGNSVRDGLRRCKQYRKSFRGIEENGIGHNFYRIGK